MNHIDNSIVTLMRANNGMGIVSISAKNEPSSASHPVRKTSINRRIKGFSRKSNARFKVALQTTFLEPKRTFAVTLPFQEGTDPGKAKKLFAKLRRWLVRTYSAYGLYSVEFKKRKNIHYHLVVGLRPSGTHQDHFCNALRVRWLKICGLSRPEGIYAEPVSDCNSWLVYMAKCDAQRRIPADFRGKMTRFWGAFGGRLVNTAEVIELPSTDQTQVRALLAEIVSGQGSFRAKAMSSAIRESRGKLNVWVCPSELEEVRILLNHPRSTKN